MTGLRFFGPSGALPPLWQLHSLQVETKQGPGPGFGGADGRVWKGQGWRQKGPPPWVSGTLGGTIYEGELTNRFVCL